MENKDPKELEDYEKIVIKDEAELLEEQATKKEEEKEVEQIDEQIEEKQNEIEEIRFQLEFYESGEAYRKNQEDYEMGMITQEEYEAEKNEIDFKFDNLKGNLKVKIDELNQLKQRREKLTGQKEIDRENESTKKENEELDLNNKEEQKVKKEDTPKEGEKKQTDHLPTDSSQTLDEQEQEQTKQPVDLQEYKKQNPLFRFFKKVVNRIKQFRKNLSKNEMVDVAREQLEQEGISIEKNEFENSDLGEELSNFVYSEEMIANHADLSVMDEQSRSTRDYDGQERN